jgi:hypothetical protein
MANRYSRNFYVRDDIWGSITPNWRVQPNIANPAGEWKPALWLPVVFTQSSVAAGEDAYVISSGKIVAMDAEGRIVPAGLREALVKATITDTVITYTADDVKWGVVDFTTGERLTAAKTVSSIEFARACSDRGFVDVAAVPTDEATVRAVIQQFISLPIGVAAYDIHVYAGTPEGGDQHFLNYNKQSLVQFVTEVEARVPHMLADTAVTDLIDVSTVTLDDAPTSGQRPADGDVLSATGVAALGRYDSDDVGAVVLITLSEREVAAITSRTPITADVSGLLAASKGSIADVTAVGDYFLDAVPGYLVITRAAWDALVTADDDPTFSFYVYSDAALAASEQWIYFTGLPDYGDRRVSVDAASNFCAKGSSADILAAADPALGTLLALDHEPRGLLASVKTAFDLDGVSAASRMPGSATAGFSHLVTRANEKVANRLAVIKIRI